MKVNAIAFEKKAFAVVVLFAQILYTFLFPFVSLRVYKFHIDCFGQRFGFDLGSIRYREFRSIQSASALRLLVKRLKACLRPTSATLADIDSILFTPTFTVHAIFFKIFDQLSYRFFKFKSQTTLSPIIFALFDTNTVIVYISEHASQTRGRQPFYLHGP